MKEDETYSPATHLVLFKAYRMAQRHEEQCVEKSRTVVRRPELREKLRKTITKTTKAVPYLIFCLFIYSFIFFYSIYTSAAITAIDYFEEERKKIERHPGKPSVLAQSISEGQGNGKSRCCKGHH
jgi:hypothetical protein